MRSVVFTIMLGGVLVAAPVLGHGRSSHDEHSRLPPERPKVGRPQPAEEADCRSIQRRIQSALADRTEKSRGERMREVVQAVREARAAGAKGCLRCIARGFARRTPVGDQPPCGRHDPCVAGDRLDPSSDVCVAAVCDVAPGCCRRRWDDRCVDLAASLCVGGCAACAHEVCIDGRALARDCSDCSALVCAGDPYCCDTAWDDACVENATAACGLTCRPVTTTTTTSSTTSTTLLAPASTTTSTTLLAAASTTTTTVAAPASTTTTVPECLADVDCEDGDPCTTNSCATAGTCRQSHNRASCDDGDLCTVGDRCLNGGCIGGPPMSCDDNDRCTIDWCTGGTCRHFAPGCSDGNVCTTDFCDPVTGCGHQTVSCDDGDPCTTDTCDFVIGCRHAAIAGCVP